MKLQILKEKDWFFIKLIWIQWVYATWSTMEEAMENFWDIYNNVMDIKKETINRETKWISSFSNFKKLELSI